MLTQLRKLTTELLFRNPWWEYRHDEYLHPDGSRGDFFYVHTSGSAVVIPQLEDGKLVLLNQFRYLTQLESLEFVGGGIKPGCSPEETAREELHEEAGFEAEHLISLGKFNPMNGATDEWCFVFLARGLTRTQATPEQSEEFEERSVTIMEIRGLITSGVLWDGMTLAAFALLERYLESEKEQ